AGAPEEGPEVLREGAVSVHPCSDTKLGIVCEVADPSDTGAGKLPLVRGARFSREHWRLQISEQAAGAGSAVLAADAVQSGNTEAGSVSGGTMGTLQHEIRDH